MPVCNRLMIACVTCHMSHVTCYLCSCWRALQGSDLGTREQQRLATEGIPKTTTTAMMMMMMIVLATKTSMTPTMNPAPALLSTATAALPPRTLRREAHRQERMQCRAAAGRRLPRQHPPRAAHVPPLRARTLCPPPAPTARCRTPTRRATARHETTTRGGARGPRAIFEWGWEVRRRRDGLSAEGVKISWRNTRSFGLRW